MSQGPFRLERPEVGPMSLLLVFLPALRMSAFPGFLRQHLAPYGAALFGMTLLVAVPVHAQFDPQAFERRGSQEVLKYTVVASFDGGVTSFL